MPAERGKPQAREAPPIPTGAIVADKYVVEAVLGTGAMGYVVAARHKLIGQRVAIKFIKSSYVDDTDALERFMREARTLVAVQSENVVRVLDYGKMPDESPYLVMELLTGRDLLAELRARGPLPLGEAAEIVLQACEGLAAVHARGIVHRDVKPANLFLTTRANGKLLVKIVDFGISKVPKLNEEELSLTRSSLGSPHYMSPEQLRSARTVDARSDVWSLGVTLYRTLTGELPFGGESVGSLMAAVMTDAPRALRTIRPDLPPEMEAIIKRCLEKNAEDRFASAQELADALAPFAMPSDRRHSEPPPREFLSPSPPPSSASGATHESTTTNAHVSQAARAPDLFADARKRRAVLAAAIAVPLVGAALALTFAPRSDHAPVTPAPKSTASSARAITDAPAPKTTNPEAAAAYQAGLQAVRDASLVAALERFERAAGLDPTMAAAELRCALYGDSLSGSVPRRHARTAIALRASLSEADRELLHASEPLYVPPRPDLVESRRRFDALSVARPQDTELILLSAVLFMNTRPRAETRAMCDRALQIDPKFAGALWLRGLIEELDWDRPAVLRTVEQCTALSPGAASCLRLRANIESVLGECAAFEADAKRMLAMEAVRYRAYDFLATALFARGEPIDAVREALRLKWKASTDEERRAAQVSDEANLAIATGDFASALKNAHELEALADTSGSESDRIIAAKLQVELNTELGQPIVAAQVADGYLRRMGAWPGRDSIDDDPRPTFYAAAVRGGLRPASERDAVHAEWIAAWNAEVEPLERSRVWLQGYAEPAQTREEAEQALAVMKEYSPLPVLVIPGAIGWSAPWVGKIYALAGHPEEAIDQLRFATSSCRALGEPGVITRARFQLGEALEARGDASGACQAYGLVVRLWGGEKRSVTANAARARMASLGCPASPGPAK